MLSAILFYGCVRSASEILDTFRPFLSAKFQKELQIPSDYLIGILEGDSTMLNWMYGVQCDSDFLKLCPQLLSFIREGEGMKKYQEKKDSISEYESEGLPFSVLSKQQPDLSFEREIIKIYLEQYGHLFNEIKNHLSVTLMPTSLAEQMRKWYPKRFQKDEDIYYLGIFSFYDDFTTHVEEKSLENDIIENSGGYKGRLHCMNSNLIVDDYNGLTSLPFLAKEGKWMIIPSDEN